MEISGPFNGQAPEDTPSRRQILTCKPASAQEQEPCAKKIIGTLARRAHRRPVTKADIDPLFSIYKEGRADRDFDAGIERALEALLSSPKFLIRVERETAGAKAAASLNRLGDFELPSHLSFFLWKSIPSDQLLQLTDPGNLSDPTLLSAL